MANPRTIARLESRILERAAHCLQFELADPRASFITITRVKLSSDITSGKIYYSVLGGKADKSKAQHMLDHAAGFIQRQVSRVLEVRRMPRLSWIYDDSAEHADDIAKLIREARERDMAINPALRDEPPIVPAKDPEGRADFAIPPLSSVEGDVEGDDEFEVEEGSDDEPAEGYEPEGDPAGDDESPTDDEPRQS